MKEIDVTTLKTMQVEILKQIDAYCHTNNVKYSIAYGTLIGAVRHKGYIPWDDDIDVVMMRDDYEKFLDGFNGYDNNLSVISTNNCETFYAPYANVFMNNTLLEEESKHGTEIGIKVDVFPVDHLPENSVIRKIIFRISLILGYLIGFKYEKSLKGKRIGHIICARICGLFLKKTNVSRMLANFARWSNKHYSNSTVVNNIVWCAAGEKGCFSVSDFENVVRLDFEGFQFDALKGYDNFLRNHYGNYMELPPIEKRVTKHTFRAWQRD